MNCLPLEEKVFINLFPCALLIFPYHDNDLLTWVAKGPLLCTNTHLQSSTTKSYQWKCCVYIHGLSFRRNMLTLFLFCLEQSEAHSSWSQIIPENPWNFRFSGRVLEHPQRQIERFCRAFQYSYENDFGEIHTMQTTLGIMSLPAKNSFSFAFLR